MAKTITITVSDRALPIIVEAIKFQPIEVVEDGVRRRRRFDRLASPVSGEEYLRRWIEFTLKRLASQAADIRETNKAFATAGVDFKKVFVDRDASEIAKATSARETAKVEIDRQQAAIMAEPIGVTIR